MHLGHPQNGRRLVECRAHPNPADDLVADDRELGRGVVAWIRDTRRAREQYRPSDDGKSSIRRLQRVRELDLLNAKQPAPVRLIPKAVIESALGILLREVDVDRLRVTSRNERVQARRRGTYSPHPRRSKRFNVSTPTFRLPWRSSASADALGGVRPHEMAGGHGPANPVAA